MILPFLVSVGILGALYATRGPVRGVKPYHWYLLSVRQPAGAPPLTEDEIADGVAFVRDDLHFQNVTHNKITFENGQRVYWFKGMWPGTATPTEFRADTPVTVYEVLGW